MRHSKKAIHLPVIEQGGQEHNKKSAGVREYWIIDPDKKSVMVWDFDNDDRAAVYDFRSRIPVGIYGGELIIDFAEIDDHLSQWMSPVPGRGSEEPFSE